MILVDTSIWVDHLRKGNDTLSLLLEQGLILTHPFIIGEISCGSMRNRREIIELLRTLPAAVAAEHDEVLHFIEAKHLYGAGIGWTDVHLLASAHLSRAPLWTSDMRLKRAAESLDIAYNSADWT
ncbi:MAG: type II toxin-antitoxin system VapC family toxin [Acidobacteria bacterium]|nr:type II toxin-antitoxin system VapC family toxin [Acidobacteriota bacterium]